jgi:uncharacterized protein (TIGR00106 family)
LALAQVYYSFSLDAERFVKSNVIAEITVVPVGTGESSLSQYVAGCVGVLEGCKEIKYELTPMGTIVEGPLDLILRLVRLMHEESFKKGVSRVVTNIRIDDRRDKKASMTKKVESVLKINPKIKTGRAK